MKEFTYTITDPVGIHARPAGILVKAAASFTSSITLIKGEKKADMKRLFALMALAVKQGENISVQINGEDEEVAAMEMEKLIREHF